MYGKLGTWHGGNIVSDGSIKSAQRVFEIIECFDAHRRPLRLKHLVDELKYPTSSVAALLKCMTELGYLSFDDVSRSYSLTARLTNLTSWVTADTYENGIVDEVLRGLQKETLELVTLATRTRLHIEYIKTYRSLGDGVQLFITQGTKRVLVQTGAGWLFLRNRSIREVTEIYRNTIRAGHLSEHEYPLDKLLMRLEHSREDDVVFATARESVRPTAHWGGGLISIEIPVPPGHRELAICIGGPSERLEARFDAIAAMLRAGRDKIAAKLDRQAASSKQAAEIGRTSASCDGTNAIPGGRPHNQGG